MNFPKRLLLASPVAFALALGFSPGDAFANGDSGDSGTGSPGSDSGAGETGGADPGDFSSAWFVSPLPNASFDVAPATLDAEIGVHQGIDDEPIATIDLLVDGQSIGAQDCVDSCTFPDIELAQGVHELQLVADSGYTTSTLVYVDEPLPSDMNGCEDTGTDTGGSETGGGETGGDEGGGGCSVTGGPASPWGLLGLPLLLLVPGLRRKRAA